MVHAKGGAACVAASILTLLACVQEVRAQGAPQVSDPSAESHLENGITFYNTSDYDKAIDEFKQGYYINRDAVFLFLLAQAYRKNGQCDRAISPYQSFLATSPAAELAKAANEGLDKCKAQSGPPPSSQPQPAPVSQPPSPSPALAPSPSSLATPPFHVPFYRDGLGDLTAGGAALALITSGVFVGIAAGDVAAANSTHSLDTYDAKKNDAAVANVIAGVGLGVGVTLAVVAVLRYHSVSANRSAEDAPPSGASGGAGAALSTSLITATPLLGGCAVELSGSF